ncbi:MAG: hypothetical protein PHI55_07620 [Burkholderiaceae bacterium]|nr:hypothetical protein [Burkholderiaceae bacterium]
MNTQYGRFAPDTMLISMYPKHALIDGEGNPLPLNLRGASYLFHEWMHYIHNVSTVHGASCFLNVAAYWNDFRFTMRDGIESQGSEVLKDKHLDLLEKRQRMMAAGRGPAGKTLPSGVSVKSCRVISVCAGEIEDEIEHPSSVAIEVKRLIVRQSRRTKTYDLAFSATDLLESIAYMLEERFLWKLNRVTPVKGSVDPYQTLFLIARHIAPRLSKSEILMCGIAALQSTTPVSQTLQLLKISNAWKAKSISVENSLRERVKTHLESSRSTTDQWLKTVVAMFPSDGPLARAALETIRYLQANLEHRRNDPFFELELIDQLHSAGVAGFGARMRELMLKHGICSFEQIRPGSDEQIGRDVQFEFAVVADDPVKNDGRRIMFSTFEFAMAHLESGGRIRRTLALRPEKCHFYASCTLSERSEHASVCERSPWDSMKWNAGSACWYREGVHQSRQLDC